MIIRERTGVAFLAGAVVIAAVLAIVLRDGSNTRSAKVPWDHPVVERDLADIKKDTLRVLVLPDPWTWEVRPKAVTGLEYELLERFADREGLVIQAIPVEHPDSMFAALQHGRGDVIAAQFTLRKEQRGWVACTRTYHTARPMVARLREDPMREERVGPKDTIAISRWSPFVDATARRRGRSKLGHVRRVDGSPEEVLMDLLLGQEHAVLVTDMAARQEWVRFPILEFNVVDLAGIPLCFAVRTNAPVLLQQLNDWLSAKEEMEFHEALAKTYLGEPSGSGALRKRSMPARVDSISPYDAAFREYGGGFGWKWQLLAAMAWKESRFDSSAVSHRGAHGIMQFMPHTATHYGLDTNLTVGDHIHAAKRYVARLDTIWMRGVPDRDQRLRFVLASYNAGVGHIIDAQRLAERLGLDPKQWEHHVERAVLMLAKPRYYMRPEMKNGYCKGSQVFHYVRDIVSLYQQLTRMRSEPVAVKPPGPGAATP
ncbi:MAG: transglycosylase SLT domain-containing protein [Flavobacteriales bacterium]|nr:transglycosylase SLT domain-containing protein [Flavobacteriales bacterium]